MTQLLFLEPGTHLLIVAIVSLVLIFLTEILIAVMFTEDVRGMQFLQTFPLLNRSFLKAIF